MNWLSSIGGLSVVEVGGQVHFIVTQLFYIHIELLVVSNLATRLFYSSFEVFSSLVERAWNDFFVFTAISSGQCCE